MPKQKSINNTEKDNRTRIWTFVAYPESAPDNWRDILDEQHIQWVESPLHDKDVNATGEAKKPHWHILLIFNGKKSFEQIKEITDLIKSPIPERCHDAKALVRYMAHMDNPEKAQYKQSDIKGHGGIDVPELLKPTASEKYEIIKQMSVYVKENDITEYKDLYEYAMFNENEWFKLLCDSATFVMNSYIKSIRHSKENKNGDKDD